MAKLFVKEKGGKRFHLLEEKEIRRPKQFNLLSVKCIRRVGVLHSWMLCCHCQTLTSLLAPGPGALKEVWQFQLHVGHCHSSELWGQEHIDPAQYRHRGAERGFVGILKQKEKVFKIFWNRNAVKIYLIQIWMAFSSGNCTFVVKNPKFLQYSQIPAFLALPLPQWSS